jgi:hypothetical protein
MPVSTATSVLASGFLPMFVPETSPTTTKASADAWAAAYVSYAVAGGILAAPTRQTALANALLTAFNPSLMGGGIPLFLNALSVFWIGLPVPGQLAIATLFVPISSPESPQPPNATPQQQANGLAQVIAGLTLGAVKVTLTAPPNTVLPLA